MTCPMKKIQATLISLLATIAVTLFFSCTRNNGDIGDWFGTWRVDELNIDGEPDPDYAPPYMIFKFQSSVVSIVWPDDANHSVPGCTGTWKQEGDKLLLRFDYGLITPTAASHLPETGTLDILKLSRSTIELEYHSPEGITYYYKLKKWG